MLGWGCLKVVLQSSTVCSVHVRLNLEICFERFPCTQKLSLKWWESTILRGTILQTVQIFNPFPPVKTKHFRQINDPLDHTHHRWLLPLHRQLSWPAGHRRTNRKQGGINFAKALCNICQLSTTRKTLQEHVSKQSILHFVRMTGVMPLFSCCLIF